MDILAFLISVVSLIVVFMTRSELKRLKKGLGTSNFYAQKPDASNQVGAEGSVEQSSNAQQPQSIPSGAVPTGGLPLRRMAGQNVAGYNYAPNAPVNYEPSQFEKWLKKDPLMKVGSLFIFLALIWFAKYAFDNNWIGIQGRILLGILFGVSVSAFGFFDTFKLKERGLTLLGLGNSIILTVVYIARFYYEKQHLLSPEVALGIMFASIAFSMFASMKFNSKQLAGFTYVLAVIVPFLTNSDGNFFGLMSYLLVLVVSAIAIVFAKRWTFLYVLSFVSFVLYSLSAFAGGGAIEKTLMIFVFNAIFVVASMFLLLVSDQKQKGVLPTYMTVATLNTMSIVAWTLIGFNETYHSVILIGWAFAYLVGGFFAYTINASKKPFIVYGANTLFLLAIITIIELAFEALTAAFAVEALMTTVAISYLVRDVKVSKKAAVLFAVPALLSFGALGSMEYGAGASALFEAYPMSLYVFLIAIITTAEFLRRFFKENYTEIKDTLIAMWGFVGLWVILLVWFVPHVLIDSDIASLVSIAIYTLVGLMLYFNNHPRQHDRLHKAGTYVLVGVIIRLLLVEIWQLEVAIRIAVFVMVGVALVITAYKYSHKKNLNSGDVDQHKQ